MEPLWHVFASVALGMTLVCFVRSGARFPRWVHRLALLLAIAGACFVFALAADNALSWRLVLAYGLVPPAAAYVGSLWLGGPFLKETEVG